MKEPNKNIQTIEETDPFYSPIGFLKENNEKLLEHISNNETYIRLLDEDHPDARNLFELVPKEEVLCIIGLFRWFNKELSESDETIKSHNIPLKDFKKTINKFPHKEIKSLKEAIDKLCKKNWLTNDDAYKIHEYIINKMEHSPLYGNLIAADMLKDLYTRGLPLESPAKDFLIVNLINFKKKRTRKPYFSLITSFIRNQNILHDDEEFMDLIKDTLSRRYNRKKDSYNKWLALIIKKRRATKIINDLYQKPN